VIKRLLISLLSIVSLSFATTYTQEDRMLDMQKLAQAMQDIQSGFFYNNVDIVKAGTQDLKKTIVKISQTKEETENKDVYERWMDGNTAMQKRIQRKIVQGANDILERFRVGDATQALQVYSKVSNECMKCHVRLRKW